MRWSAITADPEAWKGVVFDGHFAANGMVSFKEYLEDSDLESIRAYVLAQANAAVAESDGQ